jgi:RimJ/RimL family protein N-acetyltransferase
VLASAFHGKGYATEAVRAAHAWGDEHLASARTVCIVAPENAASLRVAERCGYREFGRTTLLDDAIVMFERDAVRAP